MKKIITSLMLLILFSTISFSQKITKKIPESILNTNSVLMLPNQESVDKLSDSMIEDLKKLEIKVVKTIVLDQNPTIRKKQFEELQEELKDDNIGNYISIDIIKYAWNSHTLGNIEREKLVTVVAIAPFNDIYADVFIIKEKNYEKTIEKLASEIEKQIK